MAKRNRKLGRAVKKAGPVITRKEAKGILKIADGNVKRATDVTSKRGGALRASAANLFIKQAAVPTRDSWKGFGDSKLAKTLRSYAGTPGTTGRMVKGQRVGGTAGTPGKGMFDKGARIDSRTGRVGYRPMRIAASTGVGELPSEEVISGEADTTSIGETSDANLPELPLPERGDTPLFGDFDLASWASGFKRARSSRQRAGRRAQGTGSMKKFKFKESF